MFQLIPCVCQSKLVRPRGRHAVQRRAIRYGLRTAHSAFDAHNIVCWNGETGVTKTGTMMTSSITGLWSHCCGC
jgi:hypothetical protein